MSKELDAVGVSSSRGYHVVTRLLVGWERLCTRGTDPRYAAERSAAMEFELWEHALVAEQRWSATQATVRLLLRGVAGMPRDLAWCRSARSGRPSAGPPIRLLATRERRRFWVPLRYGHVFDQTNGMIDEEWPQLRRYRPDVRDATGSTPEARGL